MIEWIVVALYAWSSNERQQHQKNGPLNVEWTGTSNGVKTVITVNIYCHIAFAVVVVIVAFFMFCFVSSLHIMIVFYYFASIEMSSMQLLQNETKTTVRYDAVLYGGAHLLILSDGHLFIHHRLSPYRQCLDLDCSQSFLWYDKINIIVWKNTSHSIGNLHTESLGVKISSSNRKLHVKMWMEIYFVSNWWRSKWNENKHFAIPKLKWLISPVAIGKMIKHTVDVATAELLQCHHSFMHFIAQPGIDDLFQLHLAN